MAKVTSLEQRRIEKSPHREGPARCLACKHEWHAVVKAGTTALECPSCKTNRGVYIGLPCTMNMQWRCRCMEWVFFIDSQGPYCANCGVRPDLLNMGP